MRHPIALAALANSANVLVASLRDARPAIFFFAFGIACFALASLVRDATLPDTFGPLFWVAAGTVQLVAFGAIYPARPADPVLGALAVLGMSYLILGTLAWVRARFS